MSTKNCTFSINNFAPALPFLASTSAVQEAEPLPQEPLHHFQQETLADLHGKYVKKVLF